MAFCVVISHSFRDVIFLLPFVHKKAFAIPGGLQNLRNIFETRLIFKSTKVLIMGSKVLKMLIDSIPLVSLHVGTWATFICSKGLPSLFLWIVL